MQIEWPLMLYTFLACIGGGFIQTTTGFGFGIFVMVFFPLYLLVLQASGLSSVIMIFLLSSLAWRYRKHLQWKQALLPAAIYLVVSTAVIRLAPHFSLTGINFWLGVLMIAIACYMAFMSKKISVRATPLSAAVCSSLSGVADGLFGIGGPPMTVYFMAVFGSDKLKYLGTIQCFFWATNLVNCVNRLSSGVLLPSTLLLAVPGIAGQFIGMAIGSKVVDRIRADQFRLFVYAFLGIAGVLTCITGLSGR